MLSRTAALAISPGRGLTFAVELSVHVPRVRPLPVTRDALRARLGISNQAASDLLRKLRAGPGHSPGSGRAA